MKKILCLILALVLLTIGLTSCASKAEKTMLEKFDYADEITNWVCIDVEDFGYIVVELYPDIAPETVKNFQKLVDDGFYDGLIFHRVIKNFMIQGGDPKGTGMGGSDEKIRGEFSSNGFENNLAHKRGILSMARRGDDPNSASSQFFICQKDYPSLDGEYAAFGEVVYGMETVDAIADVRTNQNDKPYTDVVIHTMKFVTPTEETNPAKVLNEPEVEELLTLEDFTSSETATNYVLIDVQDYGKIVVKLDPDTAPITVANFQKLVGEEFYDGLIFHRIIENFMIQGGAPKSGSVDSIKGEFSSNGVQNGLLHKRGVISMARSNHPDSASSQFFICHKDSHHLDGDYAAFGKVVVGIETVDAIAVVETDANDKPLSDVVISSIRFVAKKAA